MAPSGKIKTQFVTNSSTEAIYLDKFSANCTENQIKDRFANWTFTPVNFTDDLSCISIASCPFSMGIYPINISDDAVGQVLFGPYADYLGDPMMSYEPVEFGGKIYAYCKEPGYVFDPENVTVSGELVVRIIAECVPDQVDEILPAWLWGPVDPLTGEVELPYLPLGTLIPGCGE